MYGLDNEGDRGRDAEALLGGAVWIVRVIVDAPLKLMGQ